jgi:hypothetical protein
VALRKTSRKHKHHRKSSYPRAQTSTQELALAKPLKRSTKFVVESSGLNPAKQKTSFAPAGGSGATRALKRALDLFGSDSLASDAKASPPEQSQKRPREFSILKDIPKSSSAKGAFSERWMLMILFF